MSIENTIGTAVKVPERLASLVLRAMPRINEKGGGINVELQPRKGWREQAKKGIASMRYRISACAVINDCVRYISLYLAATHDNELIDLGMLGDKPFLLKNENGSPKLCPRFGAGTFDSAAIAMDAEGVALLDENGMPVFTEPAIITDSGEEFNLCFGTLFFVPCNNGLTLKLDGVSLHEREEGQMAPDGRPYIDVHCDDYEIIARQQCRPKGKSMGFGGCMATKQAEAARKTAETVPETPATVIDESPEEI